MNRSNWNACAVTAAAMILLLASALSAAEGEHREHGAHEHGRGLLNVVVEGNELVIEFEMPGVNVVGFEHEEGEHHSGEHSEHESKSEHAEHEGEEHSELHAQYEFHCDTPDALENLEVRLFDHLRDVEEIDVQLVTPTIQTAMELHVTSAVVRLAKR